MIVISIFEKDLGGHLWMIDLIFLKMLTIVKIDIEYFSGQPTYQAQNASHDYDTATGDPRIPGVESIYE